MYLGILIEAISKFYLYWVLGISNGSDCVAVMLALEPEGHRKITRSRREEVEELQHSSTLYEFRSTQHILAI